jgi:hypothetical protein
MKDAETASRADAMTDAHVLKNFEKNPCALFYFTFPNWDTPEDEAEYMKWKELSDKEFGEEFEQWEKFDAEKKKPQLRKARHGIARFAEALNRNYNISFAESGVLAGYGKQAIELMCEDFESAVLSGEYENLLPGAYFPEEVVAKIKEDAKNRATI